MIGICSSCLLHTLVVCLTSCALLHRLLPKIKLVKLDTVWERLIWTARLHHSKQTLPESTSEWASLGYNDADRIWNFLRPFFATRGYTLYKPHPMGVTVPSLEGLSPSQSYPYAQVVTDDILGFSRISELVRAAQDAYGNHVVIKLVSDKDGPSDEWRILQYLNKRELRQDPRNHTISLLDFLTFDDFVFAIMPRWDNAFYAPFTKVSELLDFAKICFETLDFLHAHRIAHQDFLEQNTGMNVLGRLMSLETCTTARIAGEVDYTFYDFGHSLIYPEGVDISSIQTDRPLRYSHAPSPRGLYNPFKSDVAMLGGMLQGCLRHAQHHVPQIEPFFDWTMTVDENPRPTACEALRRFLELYNRVTPAQMEAPVNATFSNPIRSKLLPSLAEMMRLRREARKQAESLKGQGHTKAPQ